MSLTTTPQSIFSTPPPAQKVSLDPRRALGSLTADCVIEEAHVDRSSITRMPVESGSTISDNIIDEPNEVTLTYGWSSGSPQNVGKFNTATISLLAANLSQPDADATTSGGGAQVTDTTPSSFANPHFIQAVYQQLLDLKASHVPFAIYTGKRVYQNMLIESIATTTDANTENSLIVRIVCLNVNLVSTTTIQLTSVNPANVADPQSGLGTTQVGTVQASPASPPSVPSFQNDLTKSAAERFPFPESEVTP